MPPPARPLVIINPVAGGGRGRRLVPAVRRWLADSRLDADITQSEGPGHAEQLAVDGARVGRSPIICVGGDGTVHEAANGLLATAPATPLGVVAAGTGNDFARNVGLPRDAAAAFRLACGGEPVPVDVGRCGSRYFLNAAGAGFDAEVAAAVNRRDWGPLRGTIPYVLCTFLELARHANRDLTIHVDGREIRRRALLVAIGNGPFLGGGMMLCPAARPDDGTLDVCIIGDVPRLEVLRILPRVFSGGHATHPQVEFHRARQVRIEGPPGTRVQVDGEGAGALPADFTVVPGALSVVGALRGSPS